MTLEELEFKQPQDFVKLGFEMEKYKYIFETELTKLNYKNINQKEFTYEANQLVSILDNIELCKKVLIILFQKKRTNIKFKEQDLLSYQEILDNITYLEMQIKNKKINFGIQEEINFFKWLELEEKQYITQN